MHCHVTYAKEVHPLWMLSLVSASIEALFFFSGHHTIFGGSSRVAEAMSSEREDRSRRPVRIPSDESGQGKSPEVETGKLGVTEGGYQSAPGDQVGPSVVDVKPEGEKAEPGAIGAQDLAPTVPTPQEESSGRILLNSITSASKSPRAWRCVRLSLKRTQGCSKR